ncbi:MAG TPA: DHHA1 domain-containing protein [Vicinamibacterales bacterium]|nr:DHHA1 domain-containing protein [Vicinamibacterales bacterium]
MTHRIYYTDAYAREFEATVVDASPHDGRPAAVLDRTAFYPTSGGQPSDAGTLGDAAVIDVIDREDGAVVHVLDREVSPGGAVTGRIDWDRRFDHMQQHTGQHVLSAAFEKVLAARTVSFHLGTERSTIDLSRDLAAAELARVEREANRIVWENRPVTVRFASDEEAAALPLRKEPKRTGKLRIVEVEGYDMSACGGTHVARSGSIGLIAVSGSEKYKGGVRIEFVCGGRALRAFGAMRDALAGSIRQLSVLPSELPDAIARLQSEARDQQRAIRGLQEKLAGFEAGGCVDRAARLGRWRVVVETVEWDAGGLKALASAAAATPDVVAAFFNPAGGLVAIARGADVAFDAGAAVKALTAQFGGRGGGRPELAQAGGLDGAPGAVLEAARQLIAAAAGSTQPS